MLQQLRLTTQHFRLSTKGLRKTVTTMPKFKLPDLDPEVFVSIPTGYDLSLEQLLAFPAFKNWLSTLRHSLSLQQDPIHTFNSDPYKLRGIEIQSIDHFGGNRLGFIKFKTDISNDAKEKLPGAVFLRGGSVAMMVSTDFPVWLNDTLLHPSHFPEHFQ